MKIIDFQTHPYMQIDASICMYKNSSYLTPDQAKKHLESLGISKICGSVFCLEQDNTKWETVKKANEQAYAIKELYGDFYQLGIRIHPDFVEQSIEEICLARQKGCFLVGEVVPCDSEYYQKAGLNKILKAMECKDMVFSFHTPACDEKEELAIERLVAEHPTVNFVAAHPGEKNHYLRHLQRMKQFKNYYLDLSGTGLFRFGMLNYGIQEVGNDRFLFGSDFPVCDASMYVGSILNDPFLSEEDKRAVLYKNAERLLRL